MMLRGYRHTGHDAARMLQDQVLSYNLKPDERVKAEWMVAELMADMTDEPDAFYHDVEIHAYIHAVLVHAQGRQTTLSSKYGTVQFEEDFPNIAERSRQ